MNTVLSQLLELSHEIGRPERGLAILGEGNTSARISPREFAVKSSGSCLATLREEELTVCSSPGILGLFERKSWTDERIEQVLLEARTNPAARKPSIETLFHAWLLTLEGVSFVGHCHPIHANKILCSPRARDFAERRIFPDEVVCCGPASVYVPYTDPGVPLACEIRSRTQGFINAHARVPKLIVLQNHGVIALGANPQAVLSCILMAEKAAEIFTGAAAIGGPNFLLPQQIERIAGRLDEAYRQRQLKLDGA